MIPEIAIIGHPNEGKSSVLSTLAEDDSVRISPYPGETTVCRTFPVTIDAREILRFTDTPGFQSPGKVLAKLQTLEGTSSERLNQLVDYCQASPELAEDHQLLIPIARGAAIIYVVNGARPIRGVDRDEMEIIRLIGKPRMAIINSKKDDSLHVAKWKDELARHFNSIRLFNAHRATYPERIRLLEALVSIDQDWHKTMSEVVTTIKKDWDNRTQTTAYVITSLLADSLSLKVSAELKNVVDEKEVREKLTGTYTNKIAKLEAQAHTQIRGLFNHNLYNYQLPPYSILHEEIFSEKTWQFMGLTKRQFMLLGGIGGGAIGAGFDVAALGHGLGLFTALGTLGGAIGAVTTRKHLDYRASVLGINISGPQITIGPAGSITLLFVMINRALHFYKHMANWSHGRRDYEKEPHTLQQTSSANYTSTWTGSELKRCRDFFTTMNQPDSEKHLAATVELERVIIDSLERMLEDH